MNRLILAFSFLSVVLSLPAKAGQERGGGDVLICKTEYPGIKLTYLADTYKSKDSFGRIGIRVKFSKEKRIELIAKQLNSSTPGLGDAILAELKRLKFNFVDEVEELDGDNIKVPKGCEKKQLAIQVIETGEVRTNKKLYRKLNKWEKAFFEVHEAFISLKNPGPDTTLVRNEVLKVIKSGDFSELIYKTLWPINHTWDQFVDVTTYGIAKLSNQKCSEIRPTVLKNINFFAHDTDSYSGSVLTVKLDNSTAGVEPVGLAEWLTHYATGSWGNGKGKYISVNEPQLRAFLIQVLITEGKPPVCN